MLETTSLEHLNLLECSCGEVFTPEKIVTDQDGERCAVCPRCKALIRLAWDE
jgi:NAD-dependent SIR2 family protein deacetylase